LQDLIIQPPNIKTVFKSYTFVVYAVALSEIAAKNIRWKYPTKKNKNQFNDVPKGTEDKTYSAVVSPIAKVV
jgi:hypothetical protein